MSRWAGLPNRLGTGGRIQSGIPQRRIHPRFESANGILLRGVVVATYEVDNTNHPSKNVSTDADPVAIYCDVLTYSNRSEQRVMFLRGCLVSQATGGIHRGRIWKPRAAQIDKTQRTATEGALDLDGPVNAGNLDGDHVLVGFIDDNVNMPVILRGIPHPSIDEGNADRGIGNRMRLKLSDGDPDFLKHHGTYYGINDSGDFVVDSRFANDGSLDEVAKEPLPPTDGKGAQRFDLPLDSEFTIKLYDMSTPETPEEKVTVVLSKNKMDVQFVDSTFQFLVDDENTEVRLGSDEENAVIDSALQTELSRIKDDLYALRDQVGRIRAPCTEYPFPLLFADLMETMAAPLIYTPAGITNIRTGSAPTANNAPMELTTEVGKYVADVLRPGESGLLAEPSSPGATHSETVKLKG